MNWSFARRCPLIALAAVVACSTAAASRVAAQTPARHTTAGALHLHPDSLHWQPFAPAPGVQVAVLTGHVDSTGTFAIRLRVPAGARLPAHWHPRREYVTLLSGSFLVGRGGGAGCTPSVPMAAGTFAVAPPQMVHCGQAQAESVLQITGEGPFQFMLVAQP
jgi:quercetin dioxygenase-like cupin family protein